MPRILAIDDIGDNLISLRAVIADAFPGAQVFTAQTGIEGIGIAVAEDPDVILLDIVMPQMDGFAVCERLKREDLARDIPVVFVTAMKDDRASRIRALECGAEAFLSKPIDATELTAQIRAMIKIKSANRQRRDEQERLERLVAERTEALERSQTAMLNLLEDLKAENESRKKVETALRESEGHFRALADSGHMLIWTSGKDKLCDYFNEPWLLFTGRSLARELGTGWTEGVHPEDLERCLAVYLGAFERREPFSMEYRLRHASGEYRWIQDDGSPRFDEEGRFLGYIGHCLDISSRKHLEQEILERERYLRAILETTQDGCWVIDTQGMILDANAACCRMLGYAADELKGMHISDLDAVEDPRGTAERIARIIANGTETFETRHIRKDGSVFDTEVSVAWLGEDLNRFVSFSRDISARKQAETALADSELRFRVLFSQAAVGIAEIDTATGRFLAVNQCYADIVGRSMDEMLATDFMSITHAEDVAGDRSCMERLITAEVERYSWEKRYVRKDGSMVWGSVTVSPLWLPGERPTHHIAIVQDITERRLAEHRVQALLHEKEIILKEVHHRVKNNMGTIMGLLSIHSSLQADPGSKAALQDASARVRSMMLLYDKLYNSDLSGSISIRSYLPALLDEVVALFPRKVPVRVDVELPDLPLGERRLSLLGIIVNELVTNSMKHAFCDREGETISIRATSSGGMVRLVLADNGKGIPEGIELDHAGGFGLQLVKLLLAQMDGSLEIQRKGGTSFVMSFST